MDPVFEVPGWCEPGPRGLALFLKHVPQSLCTSLFSPPSAAKGCSRLPWVPAPGWQGAQGASLELAPEGMGGWGAVLALQAALSQLGGDRAGPEQEGELSRLPGSCLLATWRSLLLSYTPACVVWHIS